MKIQIVGCNNDKCKWNKRVRRIWEEWWAKKGIDTEPAGSMWEGDNIKTMEVMWKWVLWRARNLAIHEGELEPNSQKIRKIIKDTAREQEEWEKRQEEEEL